MHNGKERWITKLKISCWLSSASELDSKTLGVFLTFLPVSVLAHLAVVITKLLPLQNCSYHRIAPITELRPFWTQPILTQKVLLYFLIGLYRPLKASASGMVGTVLVVPPLESKLCVGEAYTASALGNYCTSRSTDYGRLLVLEV